MDHFNTYLLQILIIFYHHFLSSYSLNLLLFYTGYTTHLIIALVHIEYCIYNHLITYLIHPLIHTIIVFDIYSIHLLILFQFCL